MEKEPSSEYRPDTKPELRLVWKGLEIVVSNTRLTREQIEEMLEASEDLPPAA